MNSIIEKLKPVSYRIDEEYQVGRDDSMPDEPIIAGIPNVFILYVTFDNGKEYKIVDYGFNLEPIPKIFPTYKEDKDTYNKMNKKQVLNLLKIIAIEEDVEQVDIHRINCLEKMIKISELNYDKDVTNLMASINMKSSKRLKEKLGNDEASSLIQLENKINEFEELSTTSPSQKAFKDFLGVDNVIPIEKSLSNKTEPNLNKNKDEVSKWIEEIYTKSSLDDSNKQSIDENNIIPLKK